MKKQRAHPLDNQGSCKNGPSNIAIAGTKTFFLGAGKTDQLEPTIKVWGTMEEYTVSLRS